jgi:hypothetical protein
MTPPPTAGLERARGTRAARVARGRRLRVLEAELAAREQRDPRARRLSEKGWC